MQPQTRSALGYYSPVYPSNYYAGEYNQINVNSNNQINVNSNNQTSVSSSDPMDVDDVSCFVIPPKSENVIPSEMDLDRPRKIKPSSASINVNVTTNTNVTTHKKASDEEGASIRKQKPVKKEANKNITLSLSTKQFVEKKLAEARARLEICTQKELISLQNEIRGYQQELKALRELENKKVQQT